MMIAIATARRDGENAAAIAAEGGLRASLAYFRDAAESARKNHDALASDEGI